MFTRGNFVACEMNSVLVVCGHSGFVVIILPYDVAHKTANRDMNVCTAVVLVRQRMRRMDQSFITTSTAAFRLWIGRHRDRVIEVQRTIGAHRSRGRIEPTITTGLSVFTVRFRKKSRLLHRVRSMRDHDVIDVARVGELLIRLATLSKISKLMSCEPTFEICSPDVGKVRDSGTALIIASIATAPDV